ncbi:MAG: hypothetical protein DI587_17135 [Variovorax paradoxus]|nr:MAG: hypothetical protein DI583_17135 [Variovorax paradoxus]PZQ08959.1 MAG: hypothetical protein DI587_17135 [Variovorax paradoxus]
MVLAATIVALLLGSVYRLDQPEPASPALHDALADAQRHATERAAAIREVRARCRATYGPTAVIFETPDGDLGCRRAGPTV